MKKFMLEFKEFAMKGNVMDMAVGVIIGGAFSKIVTSLVNDIIMPIFASILGSNSFNNIKILLVDRGDNGGEISTYLLIGQFLQNVFDFLIIAFSIFIAIRLINKLTRKKEEIKQPEESKKSEDTLLLEEIRDLLKSK